MQRKLIPILVVLVASISAASESMKLSGSRVVLPEGNVIGAAFYEEKGMFFVQQSVLSTEKGGLVIRSRRQLSSWTLKGRTMVVKRIFDAAPEISPAYPCGRIEISGRLRRVFLCSAGSDIEALDADTLHTVGIFAQSSDRSISDFAVDDTRDRLLVLSSRSNGTVCLTAYSLSNGAKQWETVLPVANATSMTLAFAPRVGNIAVAVNGGSSRSQSQLMLNRV